MTAYDKGYDAFLRGESDGDNPYGYEYEPDNFDEWLNGWCAAAAQHEEGR
jgi:ribosome modulation factor